MLEGVYFGHIVSFSEYISRVKSKRSNLVTTNDSANGPSVLSFYMTYILSCSKVVPWLLSCFSFNKVYFVTAIVLFFLAQP